MNTKKSSPWIPLIVVLVVFAGTFITSGDEEPGTIFAILVVVLLITVGVLARQKAKAKKAEAEERPEDPRMKTFTKPDAPCVVCEHTGEDHLQRDKQNRIRQLDDWLKTGLIDRKEYVVLKDRYERDL
jgi:flagellar basal body-associated protein FliL